VEILYLNVANVVNPMKRENFRVGKPVGVRIVKNILNSFSGTENSILTWALREAWTVGASIRPRPFPSKLFPVHHESSYIVRITDSDVKWTPLHTKDDKEMTALVTLMHLSRTASNSMLGFASGCSVVTCDRYHCPHWSHTVALEPVWATSSL
jgi:hypothetical protein